MKDLIPAILLISILSAHAHEQHHAKETHDSKTKAELSSETLRLINEDYIKNVQGIFKKSCFDCHSTQTRYPWYSNLPGAKQLIASDIAEAKKHLDLTNGFPFMGHGTPSEDLEAIRKAMDEGSMPPFRYRILHPGSTLTDSNKQAIREWVDKGLKLLKETT